MCALPYADSSVSFSGGALKHFNGLGHLVKSDFAGLIGVNLSQSGSIGVY
jgi:hypothetical protein